ncbi:hypothetical protein ACH5RR_028226 [Cinchona calisaya]|uniref:Uncharacterized protein n=1 Tax=Cinchona calisaya TaxID=153742 RepID=A0ABD2YS44_9GENT
MASLIQENMACMNNNEEGLNPEIPQRDDTILMSFLEDPVQLDQHCDDERLRGVIQSLEAAINNPILINGHGSLDDGYQLQDCLFDQLMSNDNSVSHDDLDFSWMDLEMSSFCSPSDHDISCWYDQVCEDDVGYNYMIDQYGGVRDYSETFLEEHIYSSLWQETNNNDF